MRRAGLGKRIGRVRKLEAGPLDDPRSTGYCRLRQAKFPDGL